MSPIKSNSVFSNGRIEILIMLGNKGVYGINFHPTGINASKSR